MKSSEWWVRGPVAVAVGALVALALSASATAAPPAVGDVDELTMQQAINRVGDGTWTQSDLAYIRSDPATADQVMDPTAAGEATGESTNDTQATAPTAENPEVCGLWYNVWYKHYSLLGSTIYEWHHKIVYCRVWNSAITRWQVRSDYMQYAQSIVNVGALTANWQYGIGQMQAHSFRQRHVELCMFKYGCYANLYPRSELWVGAVGRYGYTGKST